MRILYQTLKGAILKNKAERSFRKQSLILGSRESMSPRTIKDLLSNQNSSTIFLEAFKTL
jgi:hypothetical protein